jgi:DNA polymerase-3 subunit gamma/tau
VLDQVASIFENISTPLTQMSYQVLARKWRPANFQQLVGQEHIVQALVNALDGNRLHHAYLFSGTRGVGKTTIARIFAKSLNCDQGIGSEPCGNCSTCSEIDEGRSLDLIEIDAASRTGVEDMRELLDNVQYAPTRGRFKIYLIDEVHMLSKNSFNALLKTLEEPPPHVKFLLATTDPQKIPVTVLSRCLQFNLKRMSRTQIGSHLQYLTEQESIEAEAGALTQLASAADGSMRDALSLLDQAIAYGAGKVQQAAVYAMLGSISADYLVRLFKALQTRQAVNLLQEARSIIEHSPDYQRLCAEMINLLQQIALFQADPGLVNDDGYDQELLQQLGSNWSADEVQLYYQILLQGRQDLLIAPDETSAFEMLMLRLLAFAPAGDMSVPDETLKKKPETVQLIPEKAPVVEIARVTEQAPVTEQASVVEIAPVAEQATPFESTDLEEDLPDEPQAEEVVDPGGEEPTTIAPIRVEPTENIQGNQQDSSAATVPVGSSDQTDNGLDWSNLAYSLGLVGLAQEIVANSVVKNYSDSELELALSPEIHELTNATIESEILQALKQTLGVSLNLRLSVSDKLSADTPVEARIERQKQERLDAIEAIKQESVVKKLQQTLAVELDESSVVKVDENL